MISPYVTQSGGDKMVFGDTAMFPIGAFENSQARFGDFARQRSEYILTTLAEDGWKEAP